MRIIFEKGEEIEHIHFEEQIDEIVNYKKNNNQCLKFKFKVCQKEINDYTTLKDVVENIMRLARPIEVGCHLCDGEVRSNAIFPRRIMLHCKDKKYNAVAGVPVFIKSANISLEKENDDDIAVIRLYCITPEEDFRTYQETTIVNCPCVETTIGKNWKSIRDIQWLGEYFKNIDVIFYNRSEDVLSQISSELQIPVYVEKGDGFLYKKRYHIFVINEFKKRLDDNDVFDTLYNYYRDDPEI